MTGGREFDVIVVGGGPAGSACSTVLARGGLNVLVIDKAGFPRHKICGDCINPFSWRLFEFLEVADQIRLLKLRTINKVRIAAMGGKEVVVDVPSDPAMPFFALKRQVLDDILLENARRAGVTLMQETRVLDIGRTGSWLLDVQSSRGLEHLRCRRLVGADGRNSFVAGKIRAEIHLPPMLGDGNRVGVQWHTQFQENIGTEIHLYKFDTGYGGVVNVDERTANVAMVVPASQAHLAQSDFQQFLHRTLLKNPRCAETCETLEPRDQIHTAFPLDPLVRRSREPDAFLVGDAHRTVEPFTGEGICFALEDGIRTADRILRGIDKKVDSIRSPSRSTFWVNRIYSPILRNHRAAESIISIASNKPWFSRLLTTTVFSKYVW